MYSGRVVVISFVTAALTSTAVFFVLRDLVAEKPARPAAAAPTPATPPAAATPAAAPAIPVSPNSEPPSKTSPPTAKSDQVDADRPIVPNVVGQTFSQAVQSLGRAGLRVGEVTRRTDPATPKDAVVATEPIAGQPAAGGAVGLVVSDGPSAIEVPAVVGRRFASGKRELGQSGLRVRTRYDYDEDRAEGVILRQSPRGGQRVAPDSIVTLVVNREDE